MLSRPLIGILLASSAGVFWGSMSIAAQYLMESVSFEALDLSARAFSCLLSKPSS